MRDFDESFDSDLEDDFDNNIMDFDKDEEETDSNAESYESITSVSSKTGQPSLGELDYHLKPRHKKSRKCEDTSKKKQGNPFFVLTIILSLTTLVSLFLCIYVLTQKGAVSASSDEVVQETALITYSQEEVDALVEAASLEAAAASEAQLKNDIQVQLETPNPSVSDVIRGLYSDSIIYLDSAGYHFIPISDSIPKHNYAEENFTVSENGVISYVENGNETSLMVLDVSQHQGSIDWEQVAEFGVDAAIIRVGYRGYGSGALMLDEYFEENIVGATTAGIDVGVYFFSQAINEAELLEETEFIFEAIAPYNITYPVVIDIEKIENDTARADALSAAERTDLVELFCSTVSAKGYEPMIYGNTYSLFSMLEIERIAQYEIWYAFYNDYLYYPYPVRLWQYTAGASIPGIEGSADLNVWLP